MSDTPRTGSGEWCKADFARELERELAAAKAQRDPLAKRKAVQLIALPLQGQTWNELYALCDDGTIWHRIEPQKWSQSLDIPQPQQEAKP